MRAMRVAVTVAFATFSSVCAAGEVPYEPSMVLIEGGSYPIGSADGPASTVTVRYGNPTIGFRP